MSTIPTTLPQVLPVSSLIQVTASLTQTPAQGQSLNTLLLIGPSAVIDPVTRIRTYTSLAQVAGDFGNTTPEYLAAVLAFEQAPQISSLLIGRWVNAAYAGQLFGSVLSAAQQTALQAITNGGFTINIDGTSHNVEPLNLSALSMNAIASAINAVLTTATCVWNSVYSQFQITSHTTGTTSSVGFATTYTTGGVTDISSLLGLSSTSSGAYLSPGLAAQTALSTVQLFDAEYGQQWYAVTVLGAVDADHEAIAPYIQGSTNYHYYGVSTQEAGCLSAASTTDIAYILAQTGYNRTGVQYSSYTPYSVVSLLSRILTTNYAGNNTTIDLMYKQEPGITAENLNATQAATLKTKNCNVFVAYDNSTAIIQWGNSTDGTPIDTVMIAAALSVTLTTAAYNLLYTNATKIPQTDAGMNQIAATFASVCSQFVTNGALAPGTWNSSGFGTLAQGGQLPKGFYIYAPPVSTQTQSARAARISVPFQIAAKLAGAVRTVDCAVTINP